MRVIYVSLLNSGDGYFLSCRDTHRTTHLLTAMMPKEIMERIAVLKLAPQHDKIEGVGVRFSQDNWDIYLPDNFTWEET
jgi:hypothetical protein